MLQIQNREASDHRQTFTQVQIFLKFSHRHCCSIRQLLPFAAESPAAMLGVAPKANARTLATRKMEMLRAIHQVPLD
jgi:hypothetical protein